MFKKHSLTLLLLFVGVAFAQFDYPKFGAKCKNDTGCMKDYEFCNKKVKNATDGTCIHKDLFPMIELEYYGFLFTAVILFITNVGGLGGGGVLIPVS